MKPGHLIFLEDEEYTVPSSSSSSSASPRLVKVDGETGEVEVLEPRPPPQVYEPLPHPADPDDPSATTAASADAPRRSSSRPATHAAGPSSWAAPGLVLLLPALLLVLLLLLHCRRRQKQPQQPQPERPSAVVTTPLRRATKLVLAPFLLAVDGLGWCVGVLCGTNGEGEARVRTHAGHARAALDRALLHDDAVVARQALARLATLGGDPAVAGWLRGAVGPLPEEAQEVEEREQHRSNLLRELEAATSHCEETLAMMTIPDREQGGSPWASALSASSTEEDQELRLVAALAKVEVDMSTATHDLPAVRRAHVHNSSKDRDPRQLLVESGRKTLGTWHRQRDDPDEQELAFYRRQMRGDPAAAPKGPLSPPPLLLMGQAGEDTGDKTAAVLLPEKAPASGTDRVVVVEEVSPREAEKMKENEEECSTASSNSSSSSSTSSSDQEPVKHGVSPAGGALVVTGGRATETTLSTAVRAPAPGDTAAAMLGCFAQSVQNELGLQRALGRMHQLEEKLQRARNGRASQMREERRAAEAEKTRRKEVLRQRGRELAEVRGRHHAQCEAADKARLERDQALFTYLWPVSLLVFTLSVYLATAAEGSSSLLLDALWQLPYHDLLYGSCKAAGHPGDAAAAAAAAAAVPAVKIVQHETRRIAGAAKPPATVAGGGASYLVWAASYLLPDGLGLGVSGALEMTGCYVHRTLILLGGTGLAVLLHHLMGGLGLGQHRPRMHVALLLYSCRSAFARLTWHSLLSMRHFLGFHLGLWVLTAWRDKGHTFAYRRLVFHGLVPFLAVGLALYDAALQLDPASPWHGLLAIKDKAMQAAVATVAAAT